MVRKHPVLLFMLLACGFSWSLWLMMLASSKGWWSVQVPTGPWGSFGPLLAAVVLAGPSGLAAGARNFMRRTLASRPSLAWLTLTLIAPAVMTALALAVHWMVAGSLPSPKFEAAAMLPVMFAVILVLGGPLGEELGWRGYMLPHLLGRASPLLASAMIAALWLLWHLPLFWLEGAAQEGSSILGFALVVACSSVIFTWCWLRSGPGLWPVLVLHTSINFCSYTLPSVLPGIEESRAFNIGTLASFALVALALVFADARLRRPAPTIARA